MITMTKTKVVDRELGHTEAEKLALLRTKASQILELLEEGELTEKEAVEKLNALSQSKGRALSRLLNAFP